MTRRRTLRFKDAAVPLGTLRHQWDASNDNGVDWRHSLNARWWRLNRQRFFDV
jgi:hypothetical protein